ncbi:MAG: hypothetical protein KDD69_14515, partial [Bdellovibrionales bacterium]|nr:hypothetical protein [Bdellovibrionales bacterium]
MPRSKHRRKNETKARKRRRSSEPRGIEQQSVHSLPESTSAPKEKLEKRSFKRLLFDDEGAGLVRLVLYAPLVVGAWVGGGIVLDHLIPFSIISASVALVHFATEVETRPDVVWRSYLRWSIAAAQVALLFGLLHLTGHLGMTVSLAFAAALGHCESYQSLTAPVPVVIRAMSTVARMSLYGVLGILSQQWQADLAHYEFFAVYGFVPGCILAAG